jgi:uncharacterized protein (DUF433 family)
MLFNHELTQGHREPGRSTTEWNVIMTTVTDIGSLIVRSDDIRGGRPRVAGTGVTVRRIVGWYKQGLSPEEIITELSHLSLAQVYAALTYYHANREEIEADITAEVATAERLVKQHTLHQNTP